MTDQGLFWDTFTTAFVETAVTSRDADGLIEIICDRAEKILDRAPSQTEVLSVTERITARIYDIHGSTLDLGKLVAFSSKLEDSLGTVFETRSMLGFRESLLEETSQLFVTAPEKEPIVRDIVALVQEPTIQTRNGAVKVHKTREKKPGAATKDFGRPSLSDDILEDEEEKLARTYGLGGSYDQYMRAMAKHTRITPVEEAAFARQIQHCVRTIETLISMGFDTETFKERGFNIGSLKEMGIDEQDLRSKGCDTVALKAIGIDEEAFEKMKTGEVTPEMAECKNIIDTGNRAFDRMVESNLRFVVKIALDYRNVGMDILDLIQEGNTGLMEAVWRFDPDKGGKLSTYSAFWIKQRIRRALGNQLRDVRLPIHIIDKISKMRKATSRIAEELGREPTLDELAEELQISTKALSELRGYSTSHASFDAEVGHDNNTTYGETFGDDHATSAVDQLIGKNDLAQLGGLLDVLDDRERKIIDARFGLDGEEHRTLEVVGVDFGVTRERIRQLQNIALKKLRKALKDKDSPNAKRLKKLTSKKKKASKNKSAK